MSEFHKHCANPESKTLSKQGVLLTSKAFCDCDRCTCQNCPDILKLLAITVTDSTCKFNSKMTPTSRVPKQNKPSVPSQSQNLLDVVNQNKHCGCDIVANAIRDDIPKNLGMSERRNEIADFLKLCDEQCKGAISKQGSSNILNVNNLECASDAKNIPENKPCKDGKEKCSPCDLRLP